MPEKNPRKPPKSIRLPHEEELLLDEEASATDRSRTGIITEALRLRRAVLDGLGVQAVGTEPGELADLTTRTILAGQRALAALKKK